MGRLSPILRRGSELQRGFQVTTYDMYVSGCGLEEGDKVESGVRANVSCYVYREAREAINS